MSIRTHHVCWEIQFGEVVCSYAVSVVATNKVALVHAYTHLTQVQVYDISKIHVILDIYLRFGAKCTNRDKKKLGSGTNETTDRGYAMQDYSIG